MSNAAISAPAGTQAPPRIRGRGGRRPERSRRCSASPTGQPEQLASHGLFCFVGADPVSGWLTGVAKADDGFVLTDVRLVAGSSGLPLPFQTSAPRVFAVGDVRASSTKRITTGRRRRRERNLLCTRGAHRRLTRPSASTNTVSGRRRVLFS
ncbi:hypothetical protein GCM10022419_106550 [Nonomuraea rosea]|uniref:FAD/NAD(P)-binding domain-containing protein n=1 Tax=Nonomuraea rosea TaxID=638574 RepID=A0ABP6ZBT0_9ACTN